MFRFYFIRGDIKGGFPLCMRHKRGEGHAPTDPTGTTNRGKDKQQAPLPPPNRPTNKQAGQKVKKLQKKFFFYKSAQKKIVFLLGGTAHITYNNPQPLYI